MSAEGPLFTKIIKVPIALDERYVFTEEYKNVISDFATVRVTVENAERFRKNGNWVHNKHKDHEAPMVIRAVSVTREQVLKCYNKLLQIVTTACKDQGIQMILTESPRADPPPAAPTSPMASVAPVNVAAPLPYTISIKLRSDCQKLEQDPLLSATLSKPQMSSLIYFHLRDDIYVFQSKDIKQAITLHTVLELGEHSPVVVSSPHHAKLTLR